MKTLKVMGIIGIIYTVICFLCICMMMGSYDYPSASAGWGVYLSIYTLALSIVCVVQGMKGLK